MNADERGSIETIAAAIMVHVQAHPLAADSAAGVARWWLAPAHAGAPLERIECALKLLVTRHAMRSVALMDGTLLYSQVPTTRQ